MNNNFYDEKPKNDFEKPKNDYGYVPRERGGCLSVFLVAIIGLNILAIFALCAQASQVSRYAISGSVLPIVALAVVIQCGVISCAVAIWNWKKWGYYGLASAYVIQAVLMLFSGNIVTVLSSIIGLMILVSLVNSRIEMFD